MKPSTEGVSGIAIQNFTCGRDSQQQHVQEFCLIAFFSWVEVYTFAMSSVVLLLFCVERAAADRNEALASSSGSLHSAYPRSLENCDVDSYPNFQMPG